MKRFFQSDIKISYHPWAYFLLFLLAHLLLSLRDLPLTLRLFLILFGFLLPLGFGAFTVWKTPARPPLALEGRGSFFVPVPWPLWVLAGSAAVVLRFWGLGRSAWWPNQDETLTGTGAIALLRHWNWNLFEAFPQMPTTLSRFCAGLVLWTHDPLFSLQFSTAFVSCLAIPMAYLACRRYFTGAFSALAVFLFMFSFWGLWTARTGYPVAPFVLWELAVFYALGKFLPAADPGAKIKSAVFLGLCAGLGPYSWISWPAVVLFVLVLLAWKFWDSRFRDWPVVLSFSLPFLAVSAPFWVYFLGGHYGRHIQSISTWNHFSLAGQFQIVARYIAALFWWCPPAGAGLPAFGGFLNALLASCFWLGVLELFRLGKKGLALGLGLFLFLLPGFLSVGFEPLRILSVFPLLLVLAVRGIQALALALPPSRRIPWVALIVLASAGMDVLRFYPPQQWFSPQSNPAQVFKGEGRQVYGFLQPYFSKQDPGLLFSEMLPETTDPSLDYETYFMNAAWNPDCSPAGVRWAALLTDSHYAPFLGRRFSGSQWVALPSPTSGKAGRRILGILPVTAENRSLFMEWRDFYGPLQEINMKILDLADGDPRSAILADLLALYPRVPNDPFLQSCFFEKLVFNYTWEKTFHPEDIWADWANFSAVFHASFARSYQDPALCEKFGRLLAVEGQTAEAKKVFQKALKLSPGNPWLKQEIGEMGLD